MEIRMQHFSHKHPLILNEIYDAKQGDVCRGCKEQIVSCKLFVYSCIHTSSTASTSDVDEECLKFLLHRSCAELPPEIQNPEFQEGSLFLISQENNYQYFCTLCKMPGDKFFYYSNIEYYCVCIKCAMFQFQSSEDRKFHHPAHSRHPLTLVQHLASFKCSACNVDDNIKDLSYICTKCPFWMHKNCADAPTSLQFQFHKHPLILSFTLPQVYQIFDQYCKLCNQMLYPSYWVYYCPNCRFFAHFQCARSNPMLSLSSSEDEMYDSDVVHLPAADETSMNLLFEQFVKALSTLNHNDNSIHGATKGIKHWTHDEHDLQLITINELNGQKNGDDNGTLLLCDGCVKPIRTDGGLFYGCVTCKYYLHKVCAELPRDIKHHLWPGTSLSAHKDEPYKYYYCRHCWKLCNGICFSAFNGRYELYEIGCASLPKTIKHEAHRHQLIQVNKFRTCKACGYFGDVHQCEKCEFNICGSCIIKPLTIKHPWDPHPLHLIYDPGMVSDHEHDYSCEFCSQVIDTNEWFYHCSDCDLSFHLRDDCSQRSRYLDFSKIKYGASNINIDTLHHHSLTLSLNKKVRSCTRCNTQLLGRPVLECAPCKAMFCDWCYR